MNRKQLEECTWKKTPKDERRDRVEQTKFSMRTGQYEDTSFRKLTGNAREVLVFDPSGTTEGTINAWVPLWSLYSDELEQRCKEERLPKLRAPYSRMRADYTGDVESSPGTTATREGASRHHATKKKSPTQLQREIDEALAKPVTASKETSVLPPSVRVARAGLESMREHGIKNLRYGLYRHAGDRMYQWGNFTGTPEHVITAVVPNAKNTASQDALIRALKWKR